MKDASILLISKVPADRRFAESVSSATGMSLVVVETADEGRVGFPSLGKGSWILVDVSREELLDEFCWRFEPLMASPGGGLSPNQVHFISDGLDLRPYSGNRLFGSLLSRCESDEAFAGRVYGNVASGMSAREISGLAEIVPGGVSTEFELAYSLDKRAILERIQKELTDVRQIPPRIAFCAVGALDELIMNAVYDASPDEAGDQRLRSVPRSTPLELKDKRRVQLQMMINDEYVAFLVKDLYGSLNKGKLLTHLFKPEFARGSMSDPSREGGGIGLAATYRSGASLIFQVRSGEQTNAIALCRLTGCFKDFRKQFKFVSVMTYS